MLHWVHPIISSGLLGYFEGLCLAGFYFSEKLGRTTLSELFTLCVTSISYASVYVYTLGWFGIKSSFHFRDLKPLIFSGNNRLIALRRESASQWQHCLSKAAHSSSKTMAADLWMESVWIFDAAGNKFWPDAECGVLSCLAVGNTSSIFSAQDLSSAGFQWSQPSWLCSLSRFQPADSNHMEKYTEVPPTKLVLL